MEQHTIRDRSERGGEDRLVLVRLTARDPFRVKNPIDVPGLQRCGVHPLDGGPGVLEANLVGPAAIGRMWYWCGQTPPSLVDLRTDGAR